MSIIFIWNGSQPAPRKPPGQQGLWQRADKTRWECYLSKHSPRLSVPQCWWLAIFLVSAGAASLKLPTLKSNRHRSFSALLSQRPPGPVYCYFNNKHFINWTDPAFYLTKSCSWCTNYNRGVHQAAQLTSYLPGEWRNHGLACSVFLSWRY